MKAARRRYSNYANAEIAKELILLHPLRNGIRQAQI
jgi:hypothetical protein